LLPQCPHHSLEESHIHKLFMKDLTSVPKPC